VFQAGQKAVYVGAAVCVVVAENTRQRGTGLHHAAQELRTSIALQ